MLFSNPQIANFINENFEPVYEMVRPVPIITIDFGNGTVVTRTLHGNIATLVCTAQGQVLDILPGIYEPSAFMDQLDQFKKLYTYINNHRNPTHALSDYHEIQRRSLALGKPRRRFINLSGPRPSFSKRAIESPLENLLAVKLADDSPTGLFNSFEKFIPAMRNNKPTNPFASLAPHVPLDSRDEQLNWNLLIKDTEVNESVRRLQIHEKLVSVPNATPAAITRWLYKEVLHADIDDPYLGLGETLFGSYPFQNEDKSPSVVAPQTARTSAIGMR